MFHNLKAVRQKLSFGTFLARCIIRVFRNKPSRTTMRSGRNNVRNDETGKLIIVNGTQFRAHLENARIARWLVFSSSKSTMVPSTRILQLEKEKNINYIRAQRVNGIRRC